jgi:SNF2 family DNA or RNA helicase
MMKTYGRVELLPGKPKRWKISELTPHVAIHFKRIFTRVRPEEAELFLTDTDEIRADILWFMQRYALETKDIGELRAGAKRVEQRIADRDKILLPTWEPTAVKGFKPGHAPYLYQTQAARIAIDQGGLLLGDEVGLGKTITAAALLCMGAPLPAGVVVQAHLAHQWMERLEEFTTLRVHVISGTNPYTLPPADVYIFRYTNIGGWIDFLKNGFLKTIIYDEIQELRHGTDTGKGRAAAIVSAHALCRMGLTATPIYNYGDEMHTIVEYIRPDLLGSREEFVREWCKTGRIVKDPDALGSYLRDTGWFLRRTEDDPTVNQSMPPANVVTVKVAWDSGAAADDAALMRALAMSVMSGSFAEAGRAARELDVKMRHMTGVAKARSVANYIRMLLRDTPRVLVGLWHRDVYAMLRESLADFRPTLYTGTESAVQKRASLAAFTIGQSRVLMMSLRSGAGLDGLQHYCDEVVIGELDWSPQVHHQLIGRLRRPGQPNQVNAHYLYTDEGSDPVLVETLGIKSDQARGLNDPGAAPRARTTDDSRVKRLAQFVLEQTAGVSEDCGICGGPSTGKPRYIVPIAEAANYPEDEREALFTADNIWFLCEPHERSVAAAAR